MSRRLLLLCLEEGVTGLMSESTRPSETEKKLGKDIMERMAFIKFVRCQMLSESTREKSTPRAFCQTGLRKSGEEV